MYMDKNAAAAALLSRMINVCLIGPRGSGKTTTMMHIKEKLEQVGRPVFYIAMNQPAALASLPLVIPENVVLMFDNVTDITEIERFLSNHRYQVIVAAQSVHAVPCSTALSGFFMIVNVGQGSQMISGTGPWNQLNKYAKYIKYTAPPTSSR